MAPVKCVKCLNPVFDEDVIKCSGLCKGELCYGCAEVQEQTFRIWSKSQKDNFVCPDCKRIVIRRASSGGEEKNTSANQAGSVSLETLHALLLQNNSQLSNMQQELVDIKRSQQHFSDSYDDLLAKIKNLDALEKEVGELKAQNTAKDNVIKDLTKRLVQVEQYSRKSQVELHNVQLKDNENVDHLEKVATKVALSLGVVIPAGEINAIHRLDHKKASPIVVEFKSRKLRELLIDSRYKSVVTNKSIFGVGAIEGRIFVNESLSPFFKNLLFQAKTVAKDKGYEYCWFRKNKVYVKKGSNAAAIALSEVEDLKKIV